MSSKWGRKNVKIVASHISKNLQRCCQYEILINTYHLGKSSGLPATRTPSSLKYKPVILGSANVDMNPPKAWKAAIRTYKIKYNIFMSRERCGSILAHII